MEKSEIVSVCAASNTFNKGMPFSLESVITVDTKEIEEAYICEDSNTIFIPQNSIEIDWINNRKFTSAENSFKAAIATGIIANLNINNIDSNRQVIQDYKSQIIKHINECNWRMSYVHNK